MASSSDIITRLIADHSKYDSGINSAKRSLDGFVKSNLSADGIIKSCTSSLLSYAGSLTSVATIITENINTARTFEQSLSQLSSLTGMTGAALDDLKQKAIDLGGSSTQTASQVVEAFKLIGSQKPELLSNANALNEVTEAAITLAEAASMEVPDAATALTASLNIMGEGADQAGRYINVLAAASQAGSVDIQGLTDIIYKSGQAATLNGLSFEQFIAIAETIGPSFGSAAEAGTALNAMLLKLETQTNSNFKPSVVGLEEALKNLSAANLSASDATKLVTETGYKALVPILQNKNALDELIGKITGTTTAEDQARTNTDNLNGAISSLSSAWEKLNLTINSGNGGLTLFVKYITMNVNAVTKLATAFGSVTSKVTSFLEKTGLLSVMLKALPSLISLIPGVNGLASGAAVVVAAGSDSSSGKTSKKNTSSVKTSTLPEVVVTASKPVAHSNTTSAKSTTSAKTATPEMDWSWLDMGEDEMVLMRVNGENWANALIESFKETLQEGAKDLGSAIDLSPVTQTFEESLSAEKLKIYNQQVEKTRDAWDYASQAISSAGQALSSTGNSDLNVAGIIMQAVAQVAFGLADALAKSKSGKMSVWAWIAEAAAGTATMIATIASIKSATAGYADGGVIGGNSYVGDKLYARVNSGETILNAAQAQTALDMMDSSRSSSGGSSRSYVSGENIYMGLNNWAKRTGRGELVFSRS